MNLARRAALLTAVIITCTLAVPAVGQPERGIDVGQGIEPRDLKTIERETVPFPAPEGLTVAVFWSTWSPRSAPALQMWQRFAEEYGEHGVRVLTVNADHQDMGQEDEAKIRSFTGEHEITLPVVVDAQLELFNEIGVIVLPTALFFKPDGTLDYKYPGLPTSAEWDIREDLEAKLGLAKEPEEEKAAAEPAYVPKNNALLFYNLGKRLDEKGFHEKARAKYIEALQKDPDYLEPLRGLERIFFAEGRSPESMEGLKALLTDNGLEGLTGKISTEDAAVPATPDAAPADAAPAPAASGGEKELSPMEKMKLLMEKKGN